MVKSYICIVSAGVLWGTLGLFYRCVSAAGFSRMDVTLIRVGVAAIIMLAALLIRGREHLRVRPRDLWMFAGTGVLSLFMLNLTYYSAIDMTSLAVAAVLLYTAPALVTVMSAIFFKEKITKRKVLALLLTLPGCALVSGIIGGGGGFGAAGILMGLGAGLSYALYTIFSRVALRRYGSLTISLYTFLFAAIPALFFSPPANTVTRMFSSLPTALLCLGVGVFTCVLPYLLYTKGLERVPNSEASIIATVEPVVATLISLILGERMTLPMAAGIVLVLGAVALINVGGKRPDAGPETAADGNE